jgi:CubicO group peptidase (beta-lactamase class C family)
MAPALGPAPLSARLTIDRVKAHTAAATIEEAIDLCVLTDMALIDAPGAAVAVVLDGRLIYSRGYGVKHRLNGGDVNEDTVFRIGSVTKQMTAAAVMQQVEAGVVSLDDPVTVHIPELELAGLVPADRVTVRHLLTHTAAIPDLFFTADGRTDPDALSDWAISLRAVALHAPPGTFYNYSNPNFALAGLVVERATGTIYQDYLAANVWGPAGMTATTLYPDEVIAGGNYSHGHMDFGTGNETIYAPDDYDNWSMAPAGYAFSTAGDLARWAVLLMDGGGEVLSPHSAAAMQASQQPILQIPDYYYGYGIFRESFEGITLNQHGGNIRGWGTYLIWEHDRRFVAAVMANTFNSLTGAAYCITDAVLEPPGAQPDDDPGGPDRWAAFEGTYDVMDFALEHAVGELSSLGEAGMMLTLSYPHGNTIFVMSHLWGDTFLADFDRDGYRNWPVTIITAGTPERVNWLRSRILVGGHRFDPRDGALRVP